MSMKQIKRNLHTFSDAELNKYAVQNQRYGLANARENELWRESCRLAELIRKELEARAEVRAFERRYRGMLQT